MEIDSILHKGSEGFKITSSCEYEDDYIKNPAANSLLSASWTVLMRFQVALMLVWLAKLFGGFGLFVGIR